MEGTLRYSNPAADGVGWSLQVSDTASKSYMILESSIPTSMKTNGLKVTACLQETNFKYHYVMSPTPSNENYYRVISIRKR
jgi:hypothetical protein